MISFALKFEDMKEKNQNPDSFRSTINLSKMYIKMMKNQLPN